MFILLTHKESLKIPASRLEEDHGVVIEEILAAKYANKVIMRQGLCIGFYDIVDIGDAEVRCGAGVPVMDVRFRIIVFSPAPLEVLSGIVDQADEYGLRVSLGFTNDVIIPCEMMQQPAEWVAHDSMWTCTFTQESEDGTMAENQLEIAVGDEIMFSVQQVLYSEDEGKRNELRDSLADEVKEAMEGAPMVVIGKINELCLGPRFWWE